MRIKLTKSKGSVSADRDLLLSCSNDRAVLLHVNADKLFLLTAENRYEFELDEDVGDDPEWEWRFPLRVLHRWHRENLPDDDYGDFAVWRGNPYGCYHYIESYTGLWLFDTTSLGRWQCVYEDLDDIVQHLDPTQRHPRDIILRATTGDWVKDRERLCYRYDVGVVIYADGTLLLVVIPDHVLVFRTSARIPSLGCDFVEWNGMVYKFTGKSIEFKGNDRDALRGIYEHIAECVENARRASRRGEDYLAEFTGQIMMRLPNEWVEEVLTPSRVE